MRVREGRPQRGLGMGPPAEGPGTRGELPAENPYELNVMQHENHKWAELLHPTNKDLTIGSSKSKGDTCSAHNKLKDPLGLLLFW